MNEQLLKMNGLSVKILDMLSFESHLGIPLKKNLHYFDKESLTKVSKNSPSSTGGR